MSFLFPFSVMIFYWLSLWEVSVCSLAVVTPSAAQPLFKHFCGFPHSIETVPVIGQGRGKDSTNA